jgi:ABC-2 type transport system permease protein
MRLGRIATLVRKDLLLSVKDWELGLMIFGPAIIMIAIGYGTTSMAQNTKLARVVVNDQDGGAFSQFMIQSGELEIAVQIPDWDAADAALDVEKAHVAVLIPAGFSKDLNTQQQPLVRLVFNVDKIARAEGAKRTIARLVNKYIGRGPPVRFESTFSKGNRFSIQSYLLQFGLVLQIIMVCLMFLPLSIGEEKEKGCLEALVLSPASMNEIIIAKVVYVASVCFGASLLMTWAYASKLEQVGLTLLYSLFGALCFASMGIALALFAKNRKHGSLLGTAAMMVFLLPMSLKELFPAVELFSTILPSQWLLTGLRQINATEVAPMEQLLNMGCLLSVGLLAGCWAAYALRRYDGARE